MKIIATTRTRNEEENIERWCMSYQWADAIIVSDGGSEDRTVEIANSCPRTFVRKFDKRVYSANKKYWRNPYGKHINFIISQAKAICGDWIIFDDCDSIPTKSLQSVARALIESAEESGLDAVMFHRIYIYGQDKYFPRLNDFGQSLWAWKLSVSLFALEDDPWKHEMRGIEEIEKKLLLPKPYSALHYFCPDEETVDKKLTFYRDSGQHPNILHPLDWCGELKPLENWMVV